RGILQPGVHEPVRRLAGRQGEELRGVRVGRQHQPPRSTRLGDIHERRPGGVGQQHAGDDEQSAGGDGQPPGPSTPESTIGHDSSTDCAGRRGHKAQQTTPATTTTSSTRTNGLTSHATSAPAPGTAVTTRWTCSTAYGSGSSTGLASPRRVSRRGPDAPAGGSIATTRWVTGTSYPGRGTVTTSPMRTSSASTC